MTFVTFAECLKAPESACLASPGFLFPFVIMALLIGVGFVARRANVTAFRRLRSRALWSSATLLVLCLVTISYFLALDPETIKGVATSPLAQTLWVTAVSGFGAAVALLAGSLGLALGGWLAKTPKPPRRAVGTRPQNLVIAIDGPAASGKGTLAKRIADQLGLPCLDTGLLYRAVARDVTATGGVLGDAAAAVTAAGRLDPSRFDDPALRGPAAGDAASLVARIPEVRAALLSFQRAFAAQPGGAVLDGRDIGTIVCPDATVKIFVTATAEERARRRHLEHQRRCEDISYDDVLADIRRRDARDADRSIAPMEPAPDAVRLDTTTLDADAAFAAAMRLIESRIGR
jgi:CMP/dCMP kinase